MPSPRWYFSHDEWSCCPPHWYSARLRSWARFLTLSDYLLPQSPPASGAQRGSVSGRRGWMGLPSGRFSQSDSHSSHFHLQMDFGTQEGLRSDQTDPGREARMEGIYCCFPQCPAPAHNSKSSLLYWENNFIIKYQIKLVLSWFVSCLLLLSLTAFWSCLVLPLRYWELEKLQWEYQRFISHWLTI